MNLRGSGQAAIIYRLLNSHSYIIQPGVQFSGGTLSTERDTTLPTQASFIYLFWILVLT